jgi:carboxypeptidase C (cathepsin A)
MRLLPSALAVLALTPLLAGAQARANERPAEAPARPAGQASTPDTVPVVTRHSMRLGGATLAYTATTGMMPIRDTRTNETEGHIFYVYYAKDGTSDPATRPLTFVFNGGPGSSTVWLHMGAYGPKWVKLAPNGDAGGPPYAFVDNPYTLLDQTDLVFLDPVGTGYSRPTTPENGPKFWGLDEDVRSVGEFIRLFLTRHERWASPKFVSGESYGTTRAAHLSGWLADNGIALNGVMLISAVLNFELSRPTYGNDIGYVGFFPSFALTAWYHKRLAPELQAMSVEAFARAVERFTMDEYAPALLKGNLAMTPQEYDAMAAKVARWLGVSADFVKANDLRPSLSRLQVELLKDRREIHGRLDSRFTATNLDPGSERPLFDPSESNIRNSYTPVLNDYVRRVLGYKTDAVYWILGGGIGQWKYEQGQYPNVVPSLERALTKNPAMKVYVAMGYYDMATPYWAVQHTLDHMRVSREARAGFVTGHFTAGHMMYIDEPSMQKLRAELRSFLAASLPQR